MKVRVLFLAVAVAAAAAWSTDVLWAGLTLERVPTFEKEFDRLLRENLQVNPDVAMIDNEAASRLRQKIDFDEFSAISHRLVEKVMHYIPDSTLIVWGRITDYTLEPHRSGFFWMGARVTGKLSIAINIYSLRFQRYSYAGDITCKAEVPKGVVWFYPLNVAVHITAQNRAAIMNDLQRDAAQRCASMVSAVIRSENERQEKITEIQGMQRIEEPSVKDLFSIPSVEAKPLETGPDSSAAKSGGQPGGAAKPGNADTTKSGPADSTAAAGPQPLDTAAAPKNDTNAVKK